MNYIDNMLSMALSAERLFCSRMARSTMRAIRITRHGGPEVLELEEIAGPGIPGPGQALVRIHAAGVNFMDVAQRSGFYPRAVPFIPVSKAPAS
jgi:hypothetical protein